MAANVERENNIQLLFGKWRNFKKQRGTRERKAEGYNIGEKSSKKRKASTNILSEEEVEELCERLESKRH